ncbi:hypothetical protein B296_00000921 [Ensete ventricosum]|uniref:Uncharacterized protein n=1 Tax=Ensete ventricosum TaxID=4639 RepID=A0A427BB22_ENSVE|nr:hypothetical protein B296_00000921 [Ensete ventricosum]
MECTIKKTTRISLSLYIYKYEKQNSGSKALKWKRETVGKSSKQSTLLEQYNPCFVF